MGDSKTARAKQRNHERTALGIQKLKQHEKQSQVHNPVAVSENTDGGLLQISFCMKLLKSDNSPWRRTAERLKFESNPDTLFLKKRWLTVHTLLSLSFSAESWSLKTCSGRRSSDNSMSGLRRGFEAGALWGAVWNSWLFDVVESAGGCV